MRYSNVDFNVVYVDPSTETAGDGSTPETALKDLPATVEEFVSDTCFLIRRTSEEFAAVIPSGTHNEMYNLMILGMPNAADLMYDLVPDEAKSAWDADAAGYANVKSTVYNGAFQMPNIRHFILHRVYLFRDNINADNYIFYFYNGNDYRACISIDHCKFGSKGLDVDSNDYAGGPVTASRLKSYMYIYYARILSISDLTMNFTVTGNTSNAYGIYCRFAEILHVEDVRIYSPMSYTSSGYYALYLSDRSDEGIECVIRNVTQKVFFNGTYEYIPCMLIVQGYLNAKIHDLKMEMGTALSEARPSNLFINNTIVYLNYLREYSVKNITVNLPDCWRCNSPAFRMSSCYSGTYIPGIEKEVRNVSIILAEENGIGSPINYSEAKNSGSSYVAAYLEFSNRDCDVYAKTPIVDNLTVIHPRGRSLYIYNARLTNATLKGAMSCYYTVADIDLLETWFPGYVLWAYDGSHVRVKDLRVNIDNPEYLYAQEPAIGTTYSNRANIFADKSNVSLHPLTCYDREDYYIYQGFTCNNEGEDGHFCQRTPNGICDTWSVRRVGGSSAALKLYNNSCNTMRTMVLGRRPFKGMQLLANTTGRHLLKMHIAYKGYPDDTDMFRRLIVSATVKREDGDVTYFSTLHGRWADDSESLWTNDDNLTQKCLELPLDLPNSEPVDVRIYFAWYSSSGFVYIDPAVTLEQPEEEE